MQRRIVGHYNTPDMPVVLSSARTEQTPALERRLHEREQMLDHTRDAVVVHDLDRTIRYWNRGAERLFGYSEGVALGQTFGSLMGHAARLTDSAAAELLAKGEWSGELDCVAANGNMLTVERRCTVIHDAGGCPSGVLSINTDVTERRRAEKEIVLLSNVLEQRIRKRTAELEESTDDLREFAYSVAHDLRAPLASIDGFSSQLERRLAPNLDAPSRHYIQRVRAGVRQMADLTDGLLALADLSHTRLQHQSVDLSALARTVGSHLRGQEPHRNVDLSIEATPPAAGDVRLLADLVEHLLRNAWKFSSRVSAAKITFAAQSLPDGSCVYCVKDNGAGFDPAHADRLFGPFQRLHTATEFEGNGIGLALVRKIVSRHSGRVWAKAVPGEGASFYFTLNEQIAPRQPVPAAT